MVEGNQRKNEERIKVLEAQVKAYKSELARMEASAAKKSGKSSGKGEGKVSGTSMSQNAPASRAAWEAQKRLRNAQIHCQLVYKRNAKSLKLH